MGLVTIITITCDKDLVNKTELHNSSDPLPEGWMRIQGYAAISNGAVVAIDNYFCPVCVQTYGTRELVKTAADSNPDLTDPE